MLSVKFMIIYSFVSVMWVKEQNQVPQPVATCYCVSDEKGTAPGLPFTLPSLLWILRGWYQEINHQSCSFSIQSSAAVAPYPPGSSPLLNALHVLDQQWGQNFKKKFLGHMLGRYFLGLGVFREEKTSASSQVCDVQSI